MVIERTGYPESEAIALQEQKLTARGAKGPEVRIMDSIFKSTRDKQE
jgi:hypothetical protein